MTRRPLASLFLALAACSVPLPALAAAPASQPASRPADLPVRKVILYSSGVGYFQHGGTLQGNAATSLRFKTDQINDILKSLVIQDSGGQVSAVTYPSLDPVSKTLSSFQINIADNPSIADLLNQLRGASVTLDFGASSSVTGIILGVERRSVPVSSSDKPDDKKVIEVPFLNLLVDGAIRSFSLQDPPVFKFDDPQLQTELTQALAALASSRDKDKKPVTIHFAGQGSRPVSVGYVVETPIWKTSYRLVLPSPPKAAADLQGWALVENQTDSDWSDVDLSLVSGRPLSFIQDLYTPLYVPRPTVRPELYASLTPQTYDEGMMVPSSSAAEDASADRRAPRQKAAEALSLRLSGSAAPANRHLSPAPSMIAAAPPLDLTASISSLASTAKLGELFQYSIPHVDLPRQSSSMLPIVTDPIDATRVSIYNASVLPKNPLNGALLKNSTNKYLLGGPVTVFDDHAYAGDARIESLPPGQSRLLSFGIDLQTLVNSTLNKTESHITAGRIVKGILQLTNKTTFSQTYAAENKSDHDKLLIVEHPVRPNWKLLSPDKPMETTDTLYRFKLDLPASKPASLTVRQEHIDQQTIALLPLEIGQLVFYSQSGEIAPDVRNAIVKAIQFKQALVDTERQIGEIQKQIDAITAEQQRIRENMKTISPQSEYYKRLLAKLNDQETQLESLHSQQDSLQAQMKTQRSELETYLSSTTLG